MALGRTQTDVLSRLRYLFLLAAAAAAIYAGLWPSLLSLGALVGVVVAPVALAGLLVPAWVRRRAALRGVARWGGSVLAIELAATAVWVVSASRRPVTLVVPRTASQQVRVVYGVVDGAPREWWRWGRRFEVPAAGIVYTRYSPDEGWYRPENPHPLRAAAPDDSGAKVLPASWTAGGTTEAAGCRFAYDEFAVGTPSAVARPGGGDPGPGWLDSLVTWGVTCRGGRLYQRRLNEPATPLRRTAPACYYDRAGSMTCLSTRAP
jgi:hypothetical protein